MLARDANGRFVEGIVPHNKKEHLIKTCPCCGKEFSVKPSLARVRCCSKGCANKLRPSPMLGKKHSEAAKRKMAEAKYGLRGEKHWNWRGGTKRIERVRFRNTMQQKIFKRDNYTCQICGQVGGSLQVDHIKSWAKHPGLRFDENNCRTLCMFCHYYTTFKRPMPANTVWGHNLSSRTEGLS